MLVHFIRRVFVFHSVYGMIRLTDAHAYHTQITPSVMKPISRIFYRKKRPTLWSELTKS